MPRSEEAEWWANAVYAAVQEIPHGKVTSYGHIALLLGERISSSIQVFMKLFLVLTENSAATTPGRRMSQISPLCGVWSTL